MKRGKKDSGTVAKIETIKKTSNCTKKENSELYGFVYNQNFSFILPKFYVSIFTRRISPPKHTQRNNIIIHTFVICLFYGYAYDNF